MENGEARGEKVNPKIMEEGKVQTHAGEDYNDAKSDTEGHQETTQRFRPQDEKIVCSVSPPKTPTKNNTTLSESARTPVKFHNSLNISLSPLIPKKPTPDLFQALEITFDYLRRILHDNYIKTKLEKYGEFERFKDLELQRRNLLVQIKISEGQRRGTWGNQELPEFLFEGLSLKIQLSAVLEKLISMLEKNADDPYLKRWLSFGEYRLYKEAERVRKNATLSSSFILKRNSFVDENYGGTAVRKRKFELMPVNVGNNDISICNEDADEEGCTPPPKRKLIFKE